MSENPFDSITIPTYIINLKSRPDRLQHILSQFVGMEPKFAVLLIPNKETSCLLKPAFVLRYQHYNGVGFSNHAQAGSPAIHSVQFLVKGKLILWLKLVFKRSFKD